MHGAQWYAPKKKTVRAIAHQRRASLTAEGHDGEAGVLVLLAPTRKVRQQHLESSITNSA